ncbi:MAG: 3-hydroxyacyl-CoA dehydrogenase NAD-binding domain-containing protein, partial [Rhodobacteraceae bacterium]|nr:3-hydroxyacyl-CoA dehydrogenase NAD-binding domain-containing protein [Paracoccaceae bacterium]
ILAEMQNDGTPGTARAIYEKMMSIHGIFRRIEHGGAAAGDCGKPVVAAVKGYCVGIGYELSISCHRIIMADTPRGMIGLPEAKVGIFPAAGGTTRLVRRLGLRDAAPFVLEGTLLPPARALAANLVDDVVAEDDLIDAATEWIHMAGPEATIKPWDRPGFRPPGGGPYHRDGGPVFAGVSCMLNGRTQGLYHGPKAALKTMYEGLLLDFDAAIRNEARTFTRMMEDPSPSTMIRSVFISKKELDRGVRKPTDLKPRSMTKLGVVGAGMMGSGIGMAAAEAGLDVLLLDRNQAAADKAKEGIAQRLARHCERGRIDRKKADATLARMTTDHDMTTLADCDIIIEAVFEDPGIKAELFARIGAHTGPETMVYSNTSTIPISRLASAFPHPHNFAGLHFFSPVERMPLVEIIRGRATTDSTIGAAFDFVRKIGKTPILVNDAMNFYANRCIIPYMNEALRMVGEGIRPALIENSARQIGMPVGPLQLLDETSLDLAKRINRTARMTMGDAYIASPADHVVERMCDLERYGRKGRAGFYQYDRNGRRGRLWDGLAGEFPLMESQPATEQIRQRLLLIQVIQAMDAYQNTVLEDPREGDVGAIFGWGFAPWSGGPFSWVDNTGPEAVRTLCNTLARACGERFAPPELLERMARDRTAFYQS